MSRNETYSEIARELTSDLWLTLAAANLDDGPNLAFKLAKIDLCNEESNFFRGDEMLLRDTGELYTGHGRLFHCNHRLCPSCLAGFQRRNRKKLSRAIENRRLSTSEMRQLITLTIPKIDEPLQKTREVVNYAWTLFRKRKWFRETILAGGKSEEFTVTPTGYHYHLHLLAITKYVFFAKLRTEWSECVQSAFSHFNIPFSTASDGLVVANCKRVYSLKNAIREVTKYITKTCSWSQCREDDVLQILRLKKFPRSFEMFGEFRHDRTADALNPCLEGNQPTVEQQDYLDKENLSDGTSSPNFDNWSEKLQCLIDSVVDVSNFRKKQLKFRHPQAHFVRRRGNFNRTVELIRSRFERLVEAREKSEPKVYFNWSGPNGTYREWSE